MIVQKYIVMLDSTPNREVFLAYDGLGRIGNASHEKAFKYDSRRLAKLALARVRATGKRWPRAEVLGVIEEIETGSS